MAPVWPRHEEIFRWCTWADWWRPLPRGLRSHADHPAITIPLWIPLWAPLTLPKGCLLLPPLASPHLASDSSCCWGLRTPHRALSNRGDRSELQPGACRGCVVCQDDVRRKARRGQLGVWGMVSFWPLVEFEESFQKRFVQFCSLLLWMMLMMVDGWLDEKNAHWISCDQIHDMIWLYLVQFSVLQYSSTAGWSDRGGHIGCTLLQPALFSYSECCTGISHTTAGSLSHLPTICEKRPFYNMLYCTVLEQWYNGRYAFCPRPQGRICYEIYVQAASHTMYQVLYSTITF